MYSAFYNFKNEIHTYCQNVANLSNWCIWYSAHIKF